MRRFAVSLLPVPPVDVLTVLSAGSRHPCGASIASHPVGRGRGGEGASNEVLAVQEERAFSVLRTLKDPREALWHESAHSIRNPQWLHCELFLRLRHTSEDRAALREWCLPFEGVAEEGMRMPAWQMALRGEMCTIMAQAWAIAEAEGLSPSTATTLILPPHIKLETRSIVRYRCDRCGVRFWLRRQAEQHAAICPKRHIALWRRVLRLTA